MKIPFKRPKIQSLIDKTKQTISETSLSGEGNHSLLYLNITQFCGALNDNIFKLFVIFMLIGQLGPWEANKILSAAGIIFVIPFLLFSHAAGVLADRYRKQTLLVWIRAFEVILILLSFFSFGFKSAWGSYTILFFLATHSAFFGPPKYSIIPELVPEKKVPKANGLITAFTYLAIILGTFLASFITEVTNRNFMIGLSFCLLISIIGFIAAIKIKKTAAQGSLKKVQPLFFVEIIKTLIFCRTKKHLLVAMFSAAYFLFIGAFTQLNIIPFAIQSLQLNEIAGGYLFLSTAIGIALGAYIAGKSSRQRIDLALPSMASLIIVIFFLLLDIFSSNLILIVISLVFVGTAGGFFIVPLESFVQIFSPLEKRGEIVATTNFLSFTGVLLAALALYLFSVVLGLSAAAGFAVVGILTFLISILLFFRLSEYSFSFIGRKLLKRIYSVHTTDLNLVEESSNFTLVLNEATPIKALILMGIVPKLHLYVPQKRGFKQWLLHFFYSIHCIDGPANLQTLIKKGEQITDDEIEVCLYKRGSITPEEDPTIISWKNLFHLHERDLFFVTIERESYSFFRALFSSKPTQVIFSKYPS